MEVYVLDDLLRRIAVIDLYESFIWKERWLGQGDFELVIQATSEYRSLLKEGTQLVQNNSDRVMTIETALVKKDDDGRSMLTVTGPSLEQIMEDRVATEGLAGLTSETNWVVTGTPGNVARHIFQKICVEGILNPGDIIPFMTPGSIYPPNTIPEPDTTFSAAIPMSTVYEALMELCEIYGLGFRLVRNKDTSQLYFNVYTGDDRTTQQTLVPAVVFSSGLDNLSNITELSTTAKSKNVAYVFSLNDSLIVYGEGASAETTGFDRRVVYIDATDIELPAGPALTAILTNKGLDELAKTTPVTAFDGEINIHGKYKYGVDYKLGDLVEMRNDAGSTNFMRVTEQIFVCDREGERSYPTLSIDSYIVPGSWESWGNETWDGGDPDETWDE